MKFSISSYVKYHYKSLFIVGLILQYVCFLTQSLTAQDIVLVAAADSVPTSYEENGKLTGILIDIINESFKRAGYSIQIQLMPWARCQEEVKKGNVDGIFSVYLTAERQKFLTYTSEVLITQVQAFFVKADSTLTFNGDLKTLSDQSIGIINHTSYGPRLDAALQAAMFKNIDLASNSETNLQKLLAGRVDIIPSYKQVVLSTAKKLGLLTKIKQLSPDIEAIPSYLAFTQKHDFTKVIDAYNKALLSMKKDGTYDKIFNKYLR